MACCEVPGEPELATGKSGQPSPEAFMLCAGLSGCHAGEGAVGRQCLCACVLHASILSFSSVGEGCKARNDERGLRGKETV